MKASNGDLKAEWAYLDSIASLPEDEWSFLGNTFKEVQSKELNLGLDLKGGMNVILEVKVEDIVRALSNYSTDETFNEAIALAKQKRVEVRETLLTCLVNLLQKLIRVPALHAIFGTIELKDQINFNTTNDEVLACSSRRNRKCH